jgi:hypothetical protein
LERDLEKVRSLLLFENIFIGDYSMDNQVYENSSESEGSENSALSIVTDLITGTTIPAPIRKNVFKAFDRLCSVALSTRQ